MTSSPDIYTPDCQRASSPEYLIHFFGGVSYFLWNCYIKCMNLNFHVKTSESCCEFWAVFLYIDASPCLALPRLASPRLASPRLALPRLALPCLASPQPWFWTVIWVCSCQWFFRLWPCLFWLCFGSVLSILNLHFTFMAFGRQSYPQWLTEDLLKSL